MKTTDFATDNNVGRKTSENVPDTNVGKIDSRKPDEIKRGLAACSADECHGQHEGCTYQDQFFCTMRMCGDALAYIQQLESRLAQVERERDALKHDMWQCQSAVCNACKHHYRPNPDVRFYECALLGRFSDFLNSDDDRPFICGKFEWRGPCPENTKEE